MSTRAAVQGDAVIWRPGRPRRPHNHETWGVIGVVDNEIEETRYRVTETGGERARLERLSVAPRGARLSRLCPATSFRDAQPHPARHRGVHVYGATSPASSAARGPTTARRSRSSARIPQFLSRAAGATTA